MREPSPTTGQPLTVGQRVRIARTHAKSWAGIAKAQDNPLLAARGIDGVVPELAEGTIFLYEHTHYGGNQWEALAIRFDNPEYKCAPGWVCLIGKDDLCPEWLEIL